MFCLGHFFYPPPQAFGISFERKMLGFSPLLFGGFSVRFSFGGAFLHRSPKVGIAMILDGFDTLTCGIFDFPFFSPLVNQKLFFGLF